MLESKKKWQPNLKFEPQIDLKQITEKLLCIEVIKWANYKLVMCEPHKIRPRNSNFECVNDFRENYSILKFIMSYGYSNKAQYLVIFCAFFSLKQKY